MGNSGIVYHDLRVEPIGEARFLPLGRLIRAAVDGVLALPHLEAADTNVADHGNCRSALCRGCLLDLPAHD